MNVLLDLEKQDQGFMKIQNISNIAVYGKALGNGYAITAIVGKESL